MSVIYLLLPLGILFAFVSVLIFIWAVKDGQFDDLDTPKLRILQDEQNINKTDCNSSLSCHSKIDSGSDYSQNKSCK
jgi:cbb3-type cytochrome oxidase maturation protein